MSTTKLNKYLRQPTTPITEKKKLTPVLLADSKGNYLEKQIKPGTDHHIKFWCAKSRTTAKELHWLQQNLAHKIGHLDNISIYIWLGTCDLTALDPKTRYKKCRTRSTYCSSGQHWVHYNCQRLSIKEIEIIEQEELEDYTCRIFEEANLKILEKVLSPAKKCANSITSYHHHDVPAITQEINTNRNDDSTEKIPETCAVCDTIITDDKYEICDICIDIAHPECMAISGNSFTCHSCSKTIKRLEPLQDENEQNESSQTLIKSCELPEDKENSQEQTHEKSLVRINNPEMQDPHNGPEITNNKGKKQIRKMGKKQRKRQTLIHSLHMNNQH
ncbi:unnamed protein product [Mytilus coruscus]|uniref:Phorbol-ester/DAG-type domain-containing protein n=1 Tax=Mytilus coruscus TaxID=42192 RepID=A0A6J8DH16_MYTCO|nr:unnamed protein product [Mytilus coruscus]